MKYGDTVGILTVSLIRHAPHAMSKAMIFCSLLNASKNHARKVERVQQIQTVQCYARREETSRRRLHILRNSFVDLPPPPLLLASMPHMLGAIKSALCGKDEGMESVGILE